MMLFYRNYNYKHSDLIIKILIILENKNQKKNQFKKSIRYIKLTKENPNDYKKKLLIKHHIIIGIGRKT